jgi:hypothetical protein
MFYHDPFIPDISLFLLFYYGTDNTYDTSNISLFLSFAASSSGMSQYQNPRELVLKALMSIDVLVVLVLMVLKYW